MYIYSTTFSDPIICLVLYGNSVVPIKNSSGIVVICMSASNNCLKPVNNQNGVVR